MYWGKKIILNQYWHYVAVGTWEGENLPETHKGEKFMRFTFGCTVYYYNVDSVLPTLIAFKFRSNKRER